MGVDELAVLSLKMRQASHICSDVVGLLLHKNRIKPIRMMNMHFMGNIQSLMLKYLN